MAYIIGAILVIITLIIVGLIMRKRIYDEVDRQENWKMDIMDRNIASELSKIKRLNLSGETQERFESWKSRWENIVDKDLTEIEEHLFDAEERADYYRFSSAKKAIKSTDEALQTIEEEIEKILNELDELMQSEEESRKKISEVGPMIKVLNKQLVQNRYRYGKAIDLFEEQLEQLGTELKHYDELVEEGNYMEASEVVTSLTEHIERLEKEIEIFPDLLTTCKTKLPQQLAELLRGVKEMEEDGYRVEQLGFEKELKLYQQRLEESVEQLENYEFSEPKSTVKDIEDRIDEMYTTLEEEAVARNYIETYYSDYEEKISIIIEDFIDTKNNVELLKESYYFDERDLEKYLAIEKAVNHLKTEKIAMDEKIHESNVRHAELRDNIEHSYEQIQEIETDLESFRESIQSLRKDEIEAKETLKTLQERINDVNRRLQKSNIPGIPRFIWDYMLEAKEKNDSVLVMIDKQPLDMIEIHEVLEESKTTVDHLIEQTDVMLDQAYLTEQVIQYANRYRSQLPELASELKKAENLFRKFDYELALETAAQAIEKAEPGALKEIEKFQSESNVH